MNWQADDFWETSLQWYEQGRRHFLALQDDYGLNVNLVLLTLYTEQKGYALSDEDLQQLIDALDGTEKILGPLRQLRRKTKAMDSGAYTDMKAAELALEKRQQSALMVMLKHCDVSEGDGKGNLARYADLQGVVGAEDAMSALHKLVNESTH